MKALDRRTTGDLVKLLVFMIVTTLATGVLVVTIGNLDFGTTREYRAEFTDATGVVKGDDIRIAGVKVGTVKNVEIADLVDGIREPFVEDVKQLRAVAENLDRNKAELDRALQVLPIKLEKVGRTAIYGSWFNFYLCQFQGKVTVAGLTVPVQYDAGSDRCELG
jgi:phospholipid/cholesterol/gamma-HCH transport system substrate-binding protein